MGMRWIRYSSQLRKVFLVFMVFHLQINGSLMLNLEGLALLEFHEKVELDPSDFLNNWDANHKDPCRWSGVCCINGRVVMLNLKDRSLSGTLAPHLGRLGNLRALVLYKNKFSGAIPKEIAELKTLELLDLRGNNFTGAFPTEIGEMSTLKFLFLGGNRFLNVSTSAKADFLSDLEYDGSFSYDVPMKFVCSNGEANAGLEYRRGSSHTGGMMNSRNLATHTESNVLRAVYDMPIHRRLFEEASNLPAIPASDAPSLEAAAVPSTGSGSFPAIPNSKEGVRKEFPEPNAQDNSPDAGTVPPIPSSVTKVDNQQPSRRRLTWWVYVLVIGGASVLVALSSMILICRSKGVATIRPWKTGLSGQLQKALITGVPQVNRTELEAACEDFSNIICSFTDYVVFKGTLSSGVEIAVVSTVIESAKDWSRRSEVHFRKKIDMLSRISHKNFVNLIGYCEEDVPFMRMMVFEYAPNGTLSEHLHVREFEHLDWNTRIRLIMGTAYCLHYMHHELKPPVVHPDLHSGSIFITDDFAAKIADVTIWKEFVRKGKLSSDDDVDHFEFPSDPSSNIYSFGILLLEMISGRVPYSEQQGSLVDWAAEYLSDSHSVGYLVDPMLKSYKNEDLDAICEIAQACILRDAKKRPTMQEIVTKLRDVTGVSPEAAKPRLSPLWWAELEILSIEAT